MTPSHRVRTNRVEASKIRQTPGLSPLLLVLLGLDDIRTSFEAHRVGADRFPDAELVGFPDCGHLPYLEQPERFNAVLARFLQGGHAVQLDPAS